ncbi:hypothetical protein PVK06_035673 [Gossypium arboreum]|uniref:Uncharacterized protein n=1 Tax=Gossypium arboreum TaxID=29729 RepID=A0ABR0NID3_GOSAR|nr:hypothetical protein PVK06_035673 [Gossypium arboreum]
MAPQGLFKASIAHAKVSPNKLPYQTTTLNLFSTWLLSRNSEKSPNRRPLSVETQRGNGNGNVEQRRVFPVQSPQVNVRRTALEQTTNRLPGNRKPTAELYDKEEKVFIPAEDQTCTVSESSISTSSQTDTERLKVEDPFGKM